MTIKEIIDGLKFTHDMFLFDPSTGEVLTKERLNCDDLITVNACEGAIKYLEAIPDVVTGISKLQTYKMFEGQEEVYVDRADVLGLFVNRMGDIK